MRIRDKCKTKAGFNVTWL